MYRFSHQPCFLNPLCSFKSDYMCKWLDIQLPLLKRTLSAENTVKYMCKWARDKPFVCFEWHWILKTCKACEIWKILQIFIWLVWFIKSTNLGRGLDCKLFGREIPPIRMFSFPKFIDPGNKIHFKPKVRFHLSKTSGKETLNMWHRGNKPWGKTSCGPKSFW